MDLTALRVTMYKGIIDSGWVDVNRLTVLVGKNESGKTSLLRALHSSTRTAQIHTIFHGMAPWPSR